MGFGLIPGPVLGHFRVHFRDPFWVTFGSTSGSRFGPLLGPVLVHFGSRFGPLLGPENSSWIEQDRFFHLCQVGHPPDRQGRFGLDGLPGHRIRHLELMRSCSKPLGPADRARAFVRRGERCAISTQPRVIDACVFLDKFGVTEVFGWSVLGSASVRCSLSLNS